jgi:hypothetical protein
LRFSHLKKNKIAPRSAIFFFIAVLATSRNMFKPGDMSATKGGRPLTDKEKFELNEQWLSAQSQPAIEPPECDVEKYREYIKDLDLNEEEQAELLKTLWHIMAAFVDMGFGLDSIQLLPASDQQQESSPIQAQEEQTNPKGMKHGD